MTGTEARKLIDDAVKEIDELTVKVLRLENALYPSSRDQLAVARKKLVDVRTKIPEGNLPMRAGVGGLFNISNEIHNALSLADITVRNVRALGIKTQEQMGNNWADAFDYSLNKLPETLGNVAAGVGKGIGIGAETLANVIAQILKGLLPVLIPAIIILIVAGVIFTKLNKAT